MNQGLQMWDAWLTGCRGGDRLPPWEAQPGSASTVTWRQRLTRVGTQAETTRRKDISAALCWPHHRRLGRLPRRAVCRPHPAHAGSSRIWDALGRSARSIRRQGRTSARLCRQRFTLSTPEITRNIREGQTGDHGPAQLLLDLLHAQIVKERLCAIRNHAG